MKEVLSIKIGYIRISTADQNTARQEVLMEQLGVDQVYIDRMSGKNTDRPELKRMMNFVRAGDTVIVESISRFARNTRDLLELVAQLKKKKKKKKSKRAKEIGKKNTQITLSNTVLQSLIDDHCRLAAESAALQKENDMMRRMMYLAVAANHKTLRSEYIETGMEVLGNGKRL